MRVAILEPELRVSGHISWLQHLRTGLRQAGHEAHLVTSSKSGRSRVTWGETRLGARWTWLVPDVVVRNDELVACLDGYDALVMSEIRVPLHDKTAIKEETLPVYVDALRRTRTPWTTALHGNNYSTGGVPFLAQLLESPSRGKAFVSTVEWPTTTFPGFENITWRIIPSPFAARLPIDAPVPRTRTVGMSGRFIWNKGQPALCFAAEHLDPTIVTEIWGACSVGMAGSPTWDVLKLMRLRHPTAQSKRHPMDPTQDAEPEIIRPFLWDFRYPGGQLVRYLGNYTDAIGVAQRLQVHLCLTGPKYSRAIDFTTLEAMDAGALCIVPPQFQLPPQRTSCLEWFESPASHGQLKKGWPDSTEAKLLAERVMELMELPESFQQEVAEHNRREVLRGRHNPEVIATEVLRAVFE